MRACVRACTTHPYADFGLVFAQMLAPKISAPKISAPKMKLLCVRWTNLGFVERTFDVSTQSSQPIHRVALLPLYHVHAGNMMDND